MDSLWSTLSKVTKKESLTTTSFLSFSSKSNKNQDIFLKISAFVYLVFAQIWLKEFGQNSLPAAAHFGQNFGPSSNRICWDISKINKTKDCAVVQNTALVIDTQVSKLGEVT